MKKIIAWILLLTVILSLSACGNHSKQAAENASQQNALSNIDGFYAGYSKVCVNPQGQIPLVGYSNNNFRWCKNIIDNVYSSAVAMSDGEVSVILINADIATTESTFANDVRMLIQAQIDISAENIIISGTHSHSLPDSGTTIAEAAQYRELLTQGIVQSAVEAWQDMKPATLSVGSIETERMNFVRHYEMSDGSVISDNHGSAAGKTFVGHTTQADPTLLVAKIEREDAQDIVMCNWRAHPHFTGGAAVYNLSSDYIGPFRDGVEDLTGANFLFLQGAAGNINEKSRMTEENRTTDYRVYGSILADYTVECLENNMTSVSSDSLSVKSMVIYGEINKLDTNVYYTAKAVDTIFKSTGDATSAMSLVTDGSIQSVYHASAAVKNYNRTTEKDGKMELTAVTIGDSFAFVTFPGEAYDSISVRVEDISPYDTMMFVGYCNGHIGYLPDEYAFEYGCYETDITRFVIGTDVQVVEAYKNLLDSTQS